MVLKMEWKVTDTRLCDHLVSGRERDDRFIVQTLWGYVVETLWRDPTEDTRVIRRESTTDDDGYN
jgi:hypothetical protein